MLTSKRVILPLNAHAPPPLLAKLRDKQVVNTEVMCPKNQRLDPNVIRGVSLTLFFLMFFPVLLDFQSPPVTTEIPAESYGSI